MRWREIPLTQGEVALVSEEDYTWLSKWKWTVSRESRNQQKLYAIRWLKKGEPGWKAETKTKIRMHREILGLSRDDPRIGHHINDNGLDNRRENLEVLESNHENMMRCETWKRKKKEEPWL